jgi:hypothetical protein
MTNLSSAHITTTDGVKEALLVDPQQAIGILGLTVIGHGHGTPQLLVPSDM